MQLDPSALTQNPFTIITVIGAPAILTNASSILGLNTSTRLMRCLDRIAYLEDKLKSEVTLTKELVDSYLAQMHLSQRQSRQFLRSLKSTYMSLGAFVLAAFLALLGGVASSYGATETVNILGLLSIGSGATGVLGLSHASLELFLASRITIKILKTNMKSLESQIEARVMPS